MKIMSHSNGREYVPEVFRDGKMRAEAVTAYGANRLKGSFILSVYLHAKNYEVRSAAYRMYKVLALREIVDRDATTPEWRRQRLEFMLDVVATQQECDIKLVKPIALR